MTETTLPDPTTSQRRLAAILTADVAGWSLLMGQDEEGTLARLKLLRRDLIDVEIARYHGRIVKTIGDGVLVEFPSVVDALRSALAVQSGMAERNRNEPEMHAHQLPRRHQPRRCRSSTTATSSATA